MMNRRVICTLLCAIVTPACLRADEPIPTLNGRWFVTKLVIDGTELLVPKSPDSFWFMVEGDVWHYSFVVDGRRTKASFKVTQTEDSAVFSVDAKLLNGAYAGRVCKGIYRIDGDVVRLCLGDTPMTPRPTRFESPAQSGLQLYELRRKQTTGAIP